MASAIFITPFQIGLGPILPPMDDPGNGSLHLTYLDNGVRTGGMSVIGHVPQATTCLVRVYAHPDTIAAMSELPDYLFIEEV